MSSLVPITYARTSNNSSHGSQNVQDSIDVSTSTVAQGSLRIRYNTLHKFEAYLSSFSQGSSSIKEVVVDARFACRGSLPEELPFLSFEERQNWFKKTFSTQFKSDSEDRYKVILSLKLLGGGLCGSKTAEDVQKNTFFQERNLSKGTEDIINPANISLSIPGVKESSSSVAEIRIDHASSSLPTGAALPLHLNQLQEQKLKDSEVKLELATYIPILGAVSSQFQETFDVEQEVSKFFSNQQKVLLLQGDSGSGKSTFGKYLENKLWSFWDPSKPIPIFIELSSLNNPETELLPEALKKLGFSESQILELKNSHSFILLLDGYDEMAKKINLFETNRLADWKAKIIISCRSQYLQGTFYQDLFTPYRNHLLQHALFGEIFIAPFKEKELDAYLQKYVCVYNPKWSAEEYKSQIAQVPGLLSLLTNPFLIYLTAEILPSLIEKHKLAKSEEKLNLLRIDLYDAFLSHWFNRQEAKLEAAGRLQGVSIDIKEAFADRTQKLAQKMYQKGVTTIVYTPPTPWGAVSEWEDFFGNQDFAPLILVGIPLKKIENNKYAFLHASFIEYLIAKAGSLEAVQEKPVSSASADAIEPAQRSADASQLSIVRKLVTQEASICQFYADFVLKNPKFKETLFQFIEKSKDSSEWIIAAANSITFLNWARVPFSGLDFSGIQVPGAYLEGALFQETNLQGANLNNCVLKDAMMMGARLQRAQMNGVEFGQLPFLKHDVDSAIFKDWAIDPENKYAHTSHPIALSPDGTMLASGSFDKNILVWDLRSGKISRVLEGHTEWISACAFSPDSTLIASASPDKTIRLWDINNGSVLHVLKGHTDWVTSCTFSPDGNTLASGSYDKTIILWDLKNGKVKQVLQGHTSKVKSCVFSSDGELLASGSGDKNILIWHVESGKICQVLQGHTDAVNSCVFSPDGQTLASGSKDKTIRIWDLKSRKVSHVLQDHTGPVNSCIFSPDGNTLASGSDDDTTHLWDLKSGKVSQVLRGHIHDVTSCAFLSDSKTLVSASLDKTIRFWDIKIPSKLNIQTSAFAIDSCAISLDGKSLASAGHDRSIYLWDLKSKKVSQILNGHTEWVNSCVFSPDGKNLASGSQDKTIRIWNIQSGKVDQILEGHTGEVMSCAFSPDGRTLATGGSDSSEGVSTRFASLWDLKSRKALQLLPKESEGAVLSCAFSPDGKTLATAGFSKEPVNKMIQLWNLETGKISQTLEGYNETVNSCVFSPDGKILAAGCEDKGIRLWDLKTGKMCQVLDGHTGPVVTCVFSPDGKIFVSGSFDKTIRIWDVESGKTLKILKGHLGNVYSCAFSPDGSILASGSLDKAIHLWKLFDESAGGSLILNPRVTWTSHPLFNAAGAYLEEIQGLSLANQRLLEQNKD